MSATTGNIVRVVFKLEDQIAKPLKQITKLINQLNSVVNKTSTSTNKLSASLNKATNTATKINTATKSQQQYNNALLGAISPGKQLLNVVKSLVATYGLYNGTMLLIQTSDALTQSTARLNLFNDGLKSTAQMTDEIYEASQRARSGYLDMMDLVAKYSAVAGDSFNSTSDIIAFTETLQKMFVVSGATGQEMYSASLQLKQALGTGRLMGEEFRAVMESAPLFGQAIAEYMSEISGNSIAIGDLKELASQGEITTDIMIGAMFRYANTVDEQFNKMPYTFQQVWTKMKNTAVKSLDQVWLKINQLMSNGDVDKVVKAVGTAIIWVANLLLWVINIVTKVIGFIQSNWALMSALFKIGLVVLFAYIVALGIVQIAKLKDTIATWKEKIAQDALNITLLVTMAIIVAIIAILFIVVAVINKVTGKNISAVGIIVGVLAWLGAFIWNLVLAIIDLVVGTIDNLLSPLITFANFIGNLFVDPLGAIIYLFRDMANNVLGIIETIANAIDKVFGTSLGDGVRGWKSAVTKFADDLVTEYTDKDPEDFNVIRNGYENIKDKLTSGKRLDLTDAYNSGYNFGAGLGDMFSTDGFNLDQESGNGGYDWGDLANQYASQTADNTGKLANIGEEELKTLRQMATQQSINRYTTAEIRIDMTNNNTIGSNMDIDGIVSSLTDKLNESLNISAEGVHI